MSTPAADTPIYRFELAEAPFEIAPLREGLLRDQAGAYASFEGWIRNHNDGRPVDGLRYEAYAALALDEGRRIVEEAVARFAAIAQPWSGRGHLVVYIMAAPYLVEAAVRAGDRSTAQRVLRLYDSWAAGLATDLTATVTPLPAISVSALVPVSPGMKYGEMISKLRTAERSMGARAVISQFSWPAPMTFSGGSEMIRACPVHWIAPSLASISLMVSFSATRSK